MKTPEEILEIVSTIEPLGTPTSFNIIDIETICELRKSLPPSFTVLEIGGLFGRSAITWALLGATVYTIDINKEFQEKLLQNAERVGLKDKITAINGNSADVKWISQVDVVWIDADHSIEGVLADIKKYEPFAKFLVCGHDYDHPDYPDVSRIVNSYYFEHTAKSRGLIWWNWVDPEVSIISLFIGRHYSLDKFFESLYNLEYDKKKINLIWHDTSRTVPFQNKLKKWLEVHQSEYRNITFINCDHAHYHFEEGDGRKALDEITHAYNHCKTYFQGQYMLAHEDDIWVEPDSLRKLIAIMRQDPLVKCSAGKCMFRPSVNFHVGEVISWTFPERDGKLVFECTNLKNEDRNDIQLVGATHLGFTLVDGNWFRRNPFTAEINDIPTGPDVTLGYNICKDGGKVALDWSVKMKHYDVDGSFTQ